jgi:acyl-coenzyme A synthetase/AMP-(fatty) acid ligase
MAHAAAASVAVIGIPDDKSGEAVKACVVLNPGASRNAAELQAHVKDKSGAPWSPKSIDFDAIPVTGHRSQGAARAVLAGPQPRRRLKFSENLLRLRR